MEEERKTTTEAVLHIRVEPEAVPLAAQETVEVEEAPKPVAVPADKADRVVKAETLRPHTEAAEAVVYRVAVQEPGLIKNLQAEADQVISVEFLKLSLTVRHIHLPRQTDIIPGTEKQP